MVKVRISGFEFTTEHGLLSDEFAAFMSEIITAKYPGGVWRLLAQESEFSLTNIVEIMQDLSEGKKIFKSAPVLIGVTVGENSYFEQAFVIVDTRG